MEVRAFFTKKGNIRYISHLDLQRSFIRALLRSGLPIGFTEGFNPHPKLVFALPLSIFQESEYEIFDFKIEGEFEYDQITTKLNSVFPDGIIITKTAQPIKKLKEVAKAGYRIKIDTLLTPQEIEQKMSGEIIVHKKTKSREFDCDISQHIINKKIYSDGKSVVIEAVLTASGNEYLNPSYIPVFLNIKAEDAIIIRTSILDKELDLLI